MSFHSYVSLPEGNLLRSVGSDLRRKALQARTHVRAEDGRTVGPFKEVS